jgi:anti-anti-sigma factor
MQLRRRAQQDPGYAVLEAVGELDVSDVDSLGESIRQAFAEGHGCVLVDLSEVSFIDSTGASSLLDEHRGAESRGRRLALVAPGEQVIRVFSILGIDQSLDIHPTVEDALASP